MRYTKEIFVGVLALAIVGGGVAKITLDIEGMPEVVPEEFSIEVNSEKAREQLKIVPADRIYCIDEESFTLNDVISQIEFAKRAKPDCVQELIELRDTIDNKLPINDVN